MGYHINHIPKGKFGEPEKITEEYFEFFDAVAQDAKIMQACELADLIGAIEGYAEIYLGITLDDILKMKKLNESAFKDGTRK